MDTTLRLAALLVLLGAVVSVMSKDMMKKSIVFDKNTPDVFYCPQSKPTGFDKLIVRARPLKKLCEHDGQPLPEDYKSDCYNDVDETEYACKEKYRIMTYINAFTNDGTERPARTRTTMRMHPPGSDNADNNYPFVRSNDKIIKVKSGAKTRRTKPSKHQ